LNGIVAGFVSDIMFQTRIESVAERLGVKVLWIGSADQIADIYIDTQLCVGSVVLDHMIQMEPQLIIIDLENNSLPWVEWIPLLKDHPEVKQIPVVCFGSHVNTQIFKKARQIGADEVLARSRFVTTLPKLIQKYVFSN
jgi:DNA-binding NarL/FixJ family response regulator